jgi:hypothetical protein
MIMETQTKDNLYVDTFSVKKSFCSLNASVFDIFEFTQI